MSRAISRPTFALCALITTLLDGCTFGTAIVGGDASGDLGVFDATVDLGSKLDAAEASPADVPVVEDLAPDVPDAPSPECLRNADCLDPSRPVCDLGANRCVQCLPSPDTCPTRRFCDPGTLTCQDGCRGDQDCVLSSSGGDGGLVVRVCDLSRRICVACRGDAECPAGTQCAGGLCAPSCGGGRACLPSETCCAGACVDLRENDANCGACGASCAAPNAAGRCRAGRCEVGSCIGAFGDCDGDASNGCETSLRSATDCGACRSACPVRPFAATVCDTASATCALRCDPSRADCNLVADDGCEVDVRESVDHCGACGRACAAAHGTARCDEGRCAIASCEAGFSDCDGDPLNGCEVDTRASAAHCGACGSRCAAGANASAQCRDGGCQVSCEAGFADCDGRVDDGCETDLRASTEHCGACGAGCVAQGGVARCASGRCEIASCEAGFADCNGRVDDGCETDLRSSATACGACGVRCPGSQRCARGACVLECPVSQQVCSGACVDRLTDPRNCGGCGSVCASNTRCVAGECSLDCAAGLAACDGRCENLLTSAANCGGCGVACPARPGATPTCQGGLCGRSCLPGRADCDGVASNGCEVDLRADASSCGTCGFRCVVANGVGACVNGGCGIAACAAGFADCDGAASDGCETPVRRDDRNCGACGNVCATGTSCVDGACVPPPGSLFVDAPTVINTIAAAAQAGAGSLTVTLGSPVGVFLPGQRVMLHQTQGPEGVAGRYELRRVAAVQGALLTLDAPLSNAYVSAGNSRAQILVVPEYSRVTVTARGTLTAPPWDGRAGGVLAVWSRGDVDVLGRVSMDGRGFRGTQHGCALGRLFQCSVGVQGESFLGPGRASVLANGGGGGGGSSGQDCAAGGGGANGASGRVGTSGDCNGGSIGECTSVCPNVGGDGGAAPRRDPLGGLAHLGGAGGEGGADEDGAFPGAGGNGGGFVWIRAEGALTVSGTVSSSGADGRNGNQSDCGGQGCGMGGGGGGAGGSIRFDVDGAAMLGDGRVLAVGGTGGLCSCRIIDLSRAAPGGGGGGGRVAVRAQRVVGQTFPTAEQE
ncbi:MAG: hypothetical protein R3A48_02990 [Polyangiales bacterium]